MTDRTISPLWFFLLPLAVMAVALAAEWYRKRRMARIERLAQVRLRLQGIPLPQPTNAFSVRTPTMLDSLMSYLMPRAYWPNDPTEGRPVLRLDTHVRLGAADRLRLLLTGDMRVLSTVYTDVEVREARTLTAIEVHPFRIKE